MVSDLVERNRTEEPDAGVPHVRICGEGAGQPGPLPGGFEFEFQQKFLLNSLACHNNFFEIGSAFKNSGFFRLISLLFVIVYVSSLNTIALMKEKVLWRHLKRMTPRTIMTN